MTMSSKLKLLQVDWLDFGSDFAQFLSSLPRSLLFFLSPFCLLASDAIKRGSVLTFLCRATELRKVLSSLSRDRVLLG